MSTGSLEALEAASAAVAVAPRVDIMTTAAIIAATVYVLALAAAATDRISKL